MRFALMCGLILAGGLAACATLPDRSAATRARLSAVACDAFAPITWSQLDSDDTLRQIHEHNAVYADLCGPPSPAIVRPAAQPVG
jgi:hypothetical protein